MPGHRSARTTELYDRRAAAITTDTDNVLYQIDTRRFQHGYFCKRRSDAHGELANVLWLTVNGRCYALAYNHKTEKIEIRDRTQSGPALHSFDNKTPVSDVEATFRAL